MSTSSSYPLSNASGGAPQGYPVAVVQHLCTGPKGLLGMWSWERTIRVPKGDLGARVHTLWLLRVPEGSLKVCMRYYAGYVVVPGVKTVSLRFKRSLEALELPVALATTPKELESLGYLEDPLCGDTGGFPLFYKASPRRMAPLFLRRLRKAGHDLAALNPQDFKESYANRRGTPR